MGNEQNDIATGISICRLARVMEVQHCLLHLKTGASLVVYSKDKDHVVLSSGNRRYTFTWEEMYNALEGKPHLLVHEEGLSKMKELQMFQGRMKATLDLFTKLHWTEGDTVVPLLDHKDLNLSEENVRAVYDADTAKKVLETPKEQQGFLYQGYQTCPWGNGPYVSLFDFVLGDEVLVHVDDFGSQFRLADPDEQPPEEQETKEETNEED
jgi:hypothetical protein